MAGYTHDEKEMLRAQLREGNRQARLEILKRSHLVERFVEHRQQRKTYKRMTGAEIMQREMDRLRNAPVALAHLETADRDESATRLLFQGLQQHYRECLMAGRLDIWATAAHNIVDLLSDPLTKVHKRSAFSNGDGGSAA